MLLWRHVLALNDVHLAAYVGAMSYFLVDTSLNVGHVMLETTATMGCGCCTHYGIVKLLRLSPALCLTFNLAGRSLEAGGFNFKLASALHLLLALV